MLGTVVAVGGVSLSVAAVVEIVSGGKFIVEKASTRLNSIVTCLGGGMQMLDWWFSSFCDRDERYRWWHPIDHVRGRWSDDYYRVPEGQRKPGHYLGCSHIVEEFLGGPSGALQHLELQFKDPRDYGLDPQRFQVTGKFTDTLTYSEVTTTF